MAQLKIHSFLAYISHILVFVLHSQTYWLYADTKVEVDAWYKSLANVYKMAPVSLPSASRGVILRRT